MDKDMMEKVLTIIRWAYEAVVLSPNMKKNARKLERIQRVPIRMVLRDLTYENRLKEMGCQSCMIEEKEKI